MKRDNSIGGVGLRWSRWAAAIILSLTGGLAATVAVMGEAADDRGPELLWPLFVNVPADIKHLLHEGSKATVGLRIDETGRVVDWICLDLPHYKLTGPLENALKEARFSPAMEAGRPVMADIEAEIDIGEAVSGSVLSITVSEALEDRLATMGISHGHFYVSAPGDLDFPLSAIERGQPIGVKNEEGTVLTGQVWVEFYIDQNGRTRLIRPEDSGQPALEQAAYLTVEQFGFQPPRRGGLPTVVRARLLVVFRPPVEPVEPGSKD